MAGMMCSQYSPKNHWCRLSFGQDVRTLKSVNFIQVFAGNSLWCKRCSTSLTCQQYFHVSYGYIISKNTKYTCDIQCICNVYVIEIFCIYNLNLFDIHGICMVYVMHITSIFFLYDKLTYPVLAPFTCRSILIEQSQRKKLNWLSWLPFSIHTRWLEFNLAFFLM